MFLSYIFMYLPHSLVIIVLDYKTFVPRFDSLDLRGFCLSKFDKIEFIQIGQNFIQAENYTNIKWSSIAYFYICRLC